MNKRSAGSIYLLLIGCLLLLIGGVMTWLMLRSYARALDMRQWLEVEATVLESRVKERKLSEFVQKEFAYHVLYGYQVGGQRLTSQAYDTRGTFWSSRPEKAQKLVEKFPVGTVAKAYVNPSDHASAVLKLDTKAVGYTLWFPLLFVLGGLVVLINALRRLARKETHPERLHQATA